VALGDSPAPVRDDGEPGDILTTTRVDSYRERSLWFGDDERPLFARLTVPGVGYARGGVLLSPPIGREARLARHTLRSVAIFLAQNGFISLRIDQFGTGDSSGTLDDEGFVDAWFDGIEKGSALLRSCGVPSVSAIGMRIGATILGAATAARDLQFSSVVFWDPCESGRSYLRELAALEALRKGDVMIDLSGPVVTSEFVFSDEAAALLSQVSMSAGTRPIAERVLVVSREDRPLPRKLRARLELERTEWATSTEQEAMLETELPLVKEPEATIVRVLDWIVADAKDPVAYREPIGALEAVVSRNATVLPVRERVVELGPEEMFGIVSEPIGDVRGPWMVMLNGVNEDHVGPSRLWVEMSRRWASFGLRSIRFDLRKFGESPWLPGEPPREPYDLTRLEDILSAVAAFSPEDQSDLVFVGLCSGAQLGLDAALRLHARGLCVINPQVGSGIVRNAHVLEESKRGFVRSLASMMKRKFKQGSWIWKVIFQVARLVLPSAYSLKLRVALKGNGTQLLILASSEDLMPFQRIPLVRSIDRRRIVSSDSCRVEVVPGLDHDMLSELGRSRAVAILDDYVLTQFAGQGGVTDNKFTKKGELR